MGRLKRSFDRLRVALSNVDGRTPGPRVTLTGALFIWLGVVIAVGASASSPQAGAAAAVKSPPADVNLPVAKPAAHRVPRRRGQGI
jgi:hypothetical protein